MSQLDNIASYVPRLLQQPLASEAPLRLMASLLFVDISGFTPLAERLAQRGAVGAEDLSRLLNVYYGHLIDVILAHGGDILKFAGDALIALWPDLTEPLEDRTLRAVQCGLAIQEMLGARPVAGAEGLAVKVGIGAGEVGLAMLGGVFGRWEILVSGEPLVQAGLAQGRAQPGEVVVCPESWQLIQDRCVARPLDDDYLRVLDVREPLTPLPAAPVARGPEAESGLRRLLPGAVSSRLRSGQTAWLAELRQLTVLFVHLPDLDHQTPFEFAQHVMHSLQTTLYYYEGSLNKLNADEKGTTLVAAFGLPPLSHEDDALRGVQAAKALQEVLAKLGLGTSIGVTTGRAFCGEIGNERRREYTMIGDVVNLSARLMQAMPGGILCDEATVQASQGRAGFEKLPTLHVKGKSEPVAVYRPTGEAKQQSGSAASMVGRRHEREAIASTLTALQAGHGGVVVLEAEAGMGKTRLVQEVVDQARRAGIPTLAGAGDAIEKSTVYHAWRPLFAQIFDLEQAPDEPEAKRRWVLERIDPDARAQAALLNVLLPVDLPDDEITLQMAGQVRAENTRHYLADLLKRHVGRAPAVLILDDAHWLDSASWALAAEVAQKLDHVLLVLSSRPMGDPLPSDYQQILKAPSLRHLKLDSLSAEETMSLICQRLGVRSLPEPIAELIRIKAEGHPFFSEELAYALRDAGLILVRDGECELSPEAPDLRSLNLPNTIEGIITSRIDRLAPSEQLALKVASVIGRVFALKTLKDVYPIAEDRGRLDELLSGLDRLDLTLVETPPPELAYIFKHIITQEVTYNLMLFAQRQQLHRTVAEWYEQNPPGELDRFYPLLAHHWMKAKDLPKAFSYLVQAGDFACQDGAFQEALRFYQEAVGLIPQLETRPDLQQMARIERQQGKASLGLGRLLDAKAHFYKSLELMGEPIPAQGAMIPALLKEVLVQTLHRFFPGRFLGKPGKQDLESLLGPAEVYEHLYEIYLFTHEQIAMAYTGLKGLNLAERAGSGPQLMWAYAFVSLLAKTAKLGGLGDQYAQWARELTRTVPDLSTQAGAFLRLGLPQLMAGNWEQGGTHLEQAIALADRLGDRRKRLECCAIIGNAALYQGNHAKSAEFFSKARLESQGELQYLCWGISGEASPMMRTGRLLEAAEWMEAAIDLFDSNPDRLLGVIFWGQLAQTYIRLGRVEEAWPIAVKVLDWLSEMPITYVLEAYFGVAEVALTLLERYPDRLPVARPVLLRAAKRVCRMGHQASGMFPIGEPQAWLWQGHYDWLHGRKSRAMRAWRRCLEVSERLRIPYEAAQAHYELGRHLPSGHAERSAHLRAAAEGFERLGSGYELGLVEAALGLPIS